MYMKPSAPALPARSCPLAYQGHSQNLGTKPGRATMWSWGKSFIRPPRCRHRTASNAWRKAEPARLPCLPASLIKVKEIPPGAKSIVSPRPRGRGRPCDDGRRTRRRNGGTDEVSPNKTSCGGGPRVTAATVADEPLAAPRLWRSYPLWGEKGIHLSYNISVSAKK